MTVREQNDKKKEYLNGYKRKSRKIKSLTDQKQSVMELMQSAKAIEYDDMPKGHKQSDLSDYIVKLERLSERIEDTKMEQNRLRLEIEEYILGMDDGIECDVLRKKYIENKTWDIIAKEVHVSERQVYKIHGKALLHFKFEENESVHSNAENKNV